jgi:hypothetical protein
MDLSFTIAAGPRQRSHSQVRIPRDSWPHFTVSDLRLPQPGGQSPHIYIPQEQGGLVIPPGTGFPFRRPERLAGLRWRYSTPPPHGINVIPVISLPIYLMMFTDKSIYLGTWYFVRWRLETRQLALHFTSSEVLERLNCIFRIQICVSDSGMKISCLHVYRKLELIGNYSQTSVHEFNSFLKVVLKPKLFFA